jgi:hypothetical protein
MRRGHGTTHLEEQFVLPRNLVYLAPQALHSRVVNRFPPAEICPVSQTEAAEG